MPKQTHSLQDQLREFAFAWMDAEPTRSTSALARLIELTPQQLNRWLKRERGVSAEVMDRLTEVLGLELTQRKGKR